MNRRSPISFSEYLADSCGTLSISDRKAKHIHIPEHMQILHERGFDFWHVMAKK